VARTSSDNHLMVANVECTIAHHPGKLVGSVNVRSMNIFSAASNIGATIARYGIITENLNQLSSFCSLCFRCKEMMKNVKP